MTLPRSNGSHNGTAVIWWASTLVVVLLSLSGCSERRESRFSYSYEGTIVGTETWHGRGRSLRVEWSVWSGSASGEAEEASARIRLSLDDEGRVLRAHFSSSRESNTCECVENCPFVVASAPWSRWASSQSPPETVTLVSARTCERDVVPLSWSSDEEGWEVRLGEYAGVQVLHGDESGVLGMQGPLGVSASAVSELPAIDVQAAAASFRPSVHAAAPEAAGGSPRIGLVVRGDDLDQLELFGGRQSGEIGCGGTVAHVAVLPLPRDATWLAEGPPSCAGQSLEACVGGLIRAVHRLGRQEGTDCEWHAEQLHQALSNAGVRSRVVTGLRLQDGESVWHSWVELESGRALDATIEPVATAVPANWLRVGASSDIDVVELRQTIAIELIDYVESLSAPTSCSPTGER